jgi:hypothetical protein
MQVSPEVSDGVGVITSRGKTVKVIVFRRQLRIRHTHVGLPGCVIEEVMEHPDIISNKVDAFRRGWCAQRSRYYQQLIIGSRY